MEYDFFSFCCTSQSNQIRYKNSLFYFFYIKLFFGFTWIYFSLFLLKNGMRLNHTKVNQQLKVHLKKFIFFLLPFFFQKLRVWKRARLAVCCWESQHNFARRTIIAVFGLESLIRTAKLFFSFSISLRDFRLAWRGERGFFGEFFALFYASAYQFVTSSLYQIFLGYTTYAANINESLISGYVVATKTWHYARRSSLTMWKIPSDIWANFGYNCDRKKNSHWCKNLWSRRKKMDVHQLFYQRVKIFDFCHFETLNHRFQSSWNW